MNKNRFDVLGMISSFMNNFNPRELEKPDPSLLKYYALMALLTGPGIVVMFWPLFFKYETLRYRFEGRQDLHHIRRGALSGLPGRTAEARPEIRHPLGEGCEADDASGRAEPDAHGTHRPREVISSATRVKAPASDFPGF